MEARLEEDSHRFTTSPPIPVGARLLVINAPDEPGRVRFSFNSQNYWTFQNKLWRVLHAQNERRRCGRPTNPLRGRRGPKIKHGLIEE
jgi:hypothetical protein